jgi:hypothetical protein
MPNRDIGTNGQRKARIGMQYRAFLDIAARTNANGFIIAANGSAKPNADIFGQDHMPNHLRIWRHPKAPLARGFRDQIIKRVKGHGVFLPVS